MKLSKNVWKVIFALLGVMFLAVGCDTYVKAQGEGWSFEAGASAKAEIKKWHWSKPFVREMKANNAPIKFSFIHVCGLDLYMPLILFVTQLELNNLRLIKVYRSVTSQAHEKLSQIMLHFFKWDSNMHF